MMKNVLPKILAAISAFILWLLIVTGQHFISVVDMPLSVYEPRPDKTLGKPLPQKVKVRVEGTARAIYFQEWIESSSLILDVGNINDNQRISLKSYFRERPNQVIMKSQMRFLEVIYPDSIDIFIDNRITKEVPVKIISDILVKPGYIQVDKPQKHSVLINGPEHYIETIDHIVTRPFRREQVDMTFIAAISLVNPNPELVTLEPEQIDVGFDVEMIGERTIVNVPVTVKNKPADLEIQLIPNTVSLRVTGGNNQIQDLTYHDFNVFFDYLTQWFPNKNYYPVKIHAPQEVLDVIRIIPEQVEVVVIRKSSQ
jgi:YbbR domain-containing protein